MLPSSAHLSTQQLTALLLSPDGPAPVWEQFDEEELAEAKLLLTEEAMIVRSAMGHADLPPDEYTEALSTAARDFIYLAASQQYSRGASATNTDRLESIKVCD